MTPPSPLSPHSSLVSSFSSLFSLISFFSFSHSSLVSILPSRLLSLHLPLSSLMSCLLYHSLSLSLYFLTKLVYSSSLVSPPFPLTSRASPPLSPTFPCPPSPVSRPSSFPNLLSLSFLFHLSFFFFFSVPPPYLLSSLSSLFSFSSIPPFYLVS